VNIAYREALQSQHDHCCPRQSIIPPNRLETGNWDLLATFLQFPGEKSRSLLQADLRKLLKRDHVFLAPSARCAIAHLLSLLPQNEVVMPAFNCGVVKSAVEAAGKKIVYVDVAKNSVNATSVEFSREAKPGRILLITHQFGVPTDVEAICQLARDRGCITIEDAACCFGAMHRGKPLGTFADFGVFSFESWKRLPAFRGGAIVINNASLFDPGKITDAPFVKTYSKAPMREMILAAGRNLATIPWIYGHLTLPVLLRNYFKPLPPPAPPGHQPWNVTSGAPFTREFHPYQAQLVSRLLRRFDSVRGHIARLVSIYDCAFKNEFVTTFLPTERDDAGILRYPVAFSKRSRAEALRDALKRGLYLETEFEQPLPDEADLSRFPHAVQAGHEVVLLPLYTSLSENRAAWLAGQVNEIARAGSE
jgi:dTDP-4-amino-4,6-dideoxygalactose transaminase